MQPEEKLRTETKRIPVEYLENLGQVTPSTPSESGNVFEADDPFKLDEKLFHEDEDERD